MTRLGVGTVSVTASGYSPLLPRKNGFCLTEDHGELPARSIPHGPNRVCLPHEGRSGHAVIPRSATVAARGEPRPARPRGRRQTHSHPGRAGHRRLRDLRRRRTLAGQVHPRRGPGEGPPARGRRPDRIRLDRPARTRRVPDAGGGRGLRAAPARRRRCVHADQRPKVERYDDTLFLVQAVNYVPHDRWRWPARSSRPARSWCSSNGISWFPCATATHTGLAVLRKQLESDPEQLALGPGAVMHAIADHVVDTYRDVSRDGSDSTPSSPRRSRRLPTPTSSRSTCSSARSSNCEGRFRLSPSRWRLQHRLQGPDVQRGAARHAGRPRPPDPGRRPDRQRRRDAVLAGAGRVGQGRHAAAPTCARSAPGRPWPRSRRSSPASTA